MNNLPSHGKILDSLEMKTAKANMRHFIYYVLIHYFTIINFFIRKNSLEECIIDLRNYGKLIWKSAYLME